MIRTALAALCFLFSASLAQAACEPKPDRAVFANPIDQSRFEAALIAEINRIRCARGGPTLRAGPRSIAKVAIGHSKWMVRHGKLSHGSRASPKSSFSYRTRATGYQGRAWGETLAQYPRYRPVGGRWSDGQCLGTLEAGGEPRQSYSGLARQIVQGWMDSRPHRRILLSDLTLASAGTVATGHPKCGTVWVTLMFAS